LVEEPLKFDSTLKADFLISQSEAMPPKVSCYKKAAAQRAIVPKFHCELNFIEYFWGVVKKYLCEHCDYTFETLKKNMPEALDSINMQTIQWWEHWMQRWMDAYQNGMETQAAQIHI
jgi:hypothetical protein